MPTCNVEAVIYLRRVHQVVQSPTLVQRLTRMIR